jgi:PAS domain S-box-containing protein
MRSGRLGDAEIAVLSEVAAPLAMLLERARTLAALREQTRRGEAILELVTALGPRESVEALATPVAAALRTMFDADFAAVTVVEGTRASVAGMDSTDAVRGTVLPPLTWDAVRMVPLGRAGHGERRVRTPIAEELRHGGLRSCLEVALGEPSAPACVVTLAARPSRHFPVSIAPELARVARPLEVAVEYFRGRRDAERRARRLEATNRILGQLSAGGSVQDLARVFLAGATRLFESANAVVLRFDHGRRVAQVTAFVSEHLPPGVVGLELPFDQLPAAAIIDPTDTITVHDSSHTPHNGPFNRKMIESGQLSVMRAPLLLNDRVTGAVVLWGPGIGHFGDEDAALLSALAGPLGVAIANAEAVTALAESELKYRSLVSQAEEMIFVVDAERRTVLEANAFTARTLGYSPDELRVLDVTEIIGEHADAVAANLRRLRDSGELKLHERRFRRKDGSMLYVDVVASLVTFDGRRAVLVMARDTTDRHAMQRQLSQAQKMESLGEMAGAVAHDFNNLLTTILGFAGILELSDTLGEADREHVALIEEAARRGAGLTGRLLSFARGGLVRFGPVDLGALIGETLRLARPALQERYTITCALPPGEVLVDGDEGQLQQALFNMILNARDAMPAGGAIHIALQTGEGTANLFVSDNGAGMDEETRMRIFEPFFTTKPAGSGTGLGMAITYGVIQGHHGTITVESEPGMGTCFRIRLPLHTAPAVAAGPEEQPGPGTPGAAVA